MMRKTAVHKVTRSLERPQDDNKKNGASSIDAQTYPTQVLSHSFFVSIVASPTSYPPLLNLTSSCLFKNSSTL
jgi:hypothetical protein